MDMLEECRIPWKPAFFDLVLYQGLQIEEFDMSAI
jgi:hypothetical protein